MLTAPSEAMQEINFQGTLRRLPLPLQDDKSNAGLAFSDLDARVRELFNIPSFTQLRITYVDAEGDDITLANDDDYWDACVAQALNPLKLNIETVGSTELVKYEDPILLPISDNSLSGFLMRWWKRWVCFGRPKKPHILHHGVRCDRCGMTPIEGSRYSSTKLPDYDLCAVCFQGSGDHDGYVKVESPLLNQLLESEKDFKGGNNVAEGVEAGVDLSFDCKLLQALVCHYTVSPGEEFPCIWHLQNNGLLPWPKETKLVAIGDNTLSQDVAIELQIPEAGLPCGEKIDACTRITTPNEVGQHVGAWSLSTPSGMTFGERPHLVLEVVDDSRQGTAHDHAGQNITLAQQASPHILEDFIKNAKAMDASRRQLNEDSQLEDDNTLTSEKIDSNLQNTVDSRVSLDGWDPMLKELQAMGFYDMQLNQHFLLKNKGSIKNAVRELVDKEKSSQKERS